MKVISYNPDGTIKDTKSVDLQVPEYVKTYEEQQSFLNITAEEVEIVNSRKNTFRKKLLLHQLTAAIKHDYANYHESFWAEIDSLEFDVDVYLEKMESDSQIQTGDRIISAIMRIYGSHSRYCHREVVVDEDAFYEQICTKEEFLICIKHLTSEEFGSNIYSDWTQVILYHALKSVRKDKFQSYSDGMKFHFHVCLQNLINRYYYSLRNMAQAVTWMPDELKQQMYVLSAFVKKADMRHIYQYRYDESFVAKYINTLYMTNEHHRSCLYKMSDIVFGANPSVDYHHGYKLLYNKLRKIEIPKNKVKEYTVTFHDCNKRPYLCFIINDNEICALRVPSPVNTLLEELQGYLKELYQNYSAVYQAKWENNIQTDSEIYFNKLNPYHEDWLGFYHHKIEQYRATDLYGSELFRPQRCFYLLLCDNVHPNKNLEFSQDIIIELIDLLKKERKDKDGKSHYNEVDECNSQIGLYECMFKINHIKKYVGQRSASDEAIDRAMKYLEPLFASDCQHVNERFRVKLRTLMKNTLSLPGVKSEMTKVTPNGFTGGFNLEIVYNILGLFRDTLPIILKSGSEKVDQYLRDKAIQSGVIHKEDNKIRKGLFYEKCRIYDKHRNEIERITYAFVNSIVESLK